MGYITRMQDPETGEVKDFVVVEHIPFCDWCGEELEITKVIAQIGGVVLYELDLCSKCAEFYGKQSPKVLDVLSERATKK
ncbi:MAG: hypothetical protein QMC77_08385 [Methanocellales archaeon]|nr:hypothetical protein [Methanocellales archaeon]